MTEKGEMLGSVSAMLGSVSAILGSVPHFFPLPSSIWSHSRDPRPKGGLLGVRSVSFISFGFLHFLRFPSSILYTPSRFCFNLETMCGILGIINRDRSTPNRQLLEAMTARLTHRGPDTGDLHTENGVGLGHRRLQVID